MDRINKINLWNEYHIATQSKMTQYDVATGWHNVRLQSAHVLKNCWLNVSTLLAVRASRPNERALFGSLQINLKSLD
jgi:hypothetical protein